MDSISNPWWLGGNICSGTLTGAEIANKLGAWVWISAHDAAKDVRGLGTGLLKTRKWERDEIVGIVSPGVKPNNGPNAEGEGATKPVQTGSLGLATGADKCTEILRLDSGEEVLVTGEGMVLAAAQSK